MVTRRALLRDGIAKGVIDRRLEHGELRRMFDGIYVQADEGRTETGQWHAELAAHLERARGEGVLSHRTAAILHGFEGVFGRPIDLSVPFESGFRTRPAIRTRTLSTEDIVTVNGLAVTSAARTLSDLGRFVGPDAVEAALNSALRGPDRRRPAEWNEALLADVNRLCASTTTRCGIARLRLVTDRRGLVRPTGSYPETLLLMATRRRGIRLEPQVEVRVIDESGSRLVSYFPDLAAIQPGATVEVEGLAGHSGAQQIDRDARRQNMLGVGFEVLRFQAGRILDDPDACAAEIANRLRRLQSMPDPRRSRITIVDPWTCELRLGN